MIHRAPTLNRAEAAAVLSGLERTLSAEQLAQVLALLDAIDAEQAAELTGGGETELHTHPGGGGGGPTVTASDPIWFPDQLTTYQLELPEAIPVDVAELVLMVQVAYLTDLNSSSFHGWERDGERSGHLTGVVAGLAGGQLLYVYSGGNKYAEIESVAGDGTAAGSVVLAAGGDDVPTTFFCKILDQEAATWVHQPVVPASNPSSSSGTWKAWRDSSDPENLVNFRFAGGIDAPTKAVLLAIDYRS